MSLPNSQSFTAVIFAIKSPQPLAINFLGARFIISTSTKTPRGAVATNECGFLPLTDTNGLAIPSWDADVGILTNGILILKEQSFAPSTADSDKKTSKRLGDQVDTNIVYYPKHKQLHCATSTNDYDNNVEKWKLQ